MVFYPLTLLLVVTIKHIFGAVYRSTVVTVVQDIFRKYKDSCVSKTTQRKKFFFCRHIAGPCFVQSVPSPAWLT